MDEFKRHTAKVFINLSSGVEFVPDLHEHNFIRIQSTLCEQKRWDQIIMDLDNNFLMYLAAGYEVVVLDCSKRKRGSRATWQGVELIRFICNNIWHNKMTYSLIADNFIPYFREVLKSLKNPTINKIKYFRKFLNTNVGEVSLTCRNKIDYKHDGDYDRFKSILTANFWIN